jgi:hypothetical protein
LERSRRLAGCSGNEKIIGGEHVYRSWRFVGPYPDPLAARRHLARPADRPAPRALFGIASNMNFARRAAAEIRRSGFANKFRAAYQPSVEERS